jgi:hypothetical protein
MVDQQSFGGQKMSLVKSLSAVVVLGAAVSTASAGISASWRQNNIPGSIAALNGYVSYSLVVNLSGNSLFNVAGLRINPSDLPGVEYYHDAFGAAGQNAPGLSALFPSFPALEFDTYVSAAGGGSTLVPGRYEDPGAAQIGNATSPDPSIAAAPGQVNIAWGGANSGTLGAQGLEIARLTFRAPGLTSGFTNVRGEVRASDDLNTAVPLPPLPVAIPEPATLGLAALGLGLVSLRRR